MFYKEMKSVKTKLKRRNLETKQRPSQKSEKFHLKQANLHLIYNNNNIQCSKDLFQRISQLCVINFRPNNLFETSTFKLMISFLLLCKLQTHW